MAEIKECDSCGKLFPISDDMTWARLCLICWKEQKSYDLTKADHAFEGIRDYYIEVVTQLEEDVQAVRNSKPNQIQLNNMDAARVRGLLLLCHPDRHKNSELSNEVTKWLLTLRRK